MNSLVTAWRNLKFRRKFAKLGTGCRFVGKDLHVEGHVELGKFCRVRDRVILRTHGDGRILLGKRVIVSYYCLIEATDLVQIGDYTGIAEFVVIRDTTHLIRGIDANWHATPLVVKPIIIGKGCGIGSRAYIGPGVTIGDGAIVGVGSMVTEDIGPFEVWAGAPARFLYHRTKDVPPEIQAETDRVIAEQGMRADRYEGR